VASAELNLSTR